jgi:proteasome component ECM29
VHLTTFISLQELCSRLPPDFYAGNPGLKQSFEALLFDPAYEGLPEAMRIKRGETLCAMATVKGCEWVYDKIQMEIAQVEKSPVVIGVLEKIKRTRE